MTAAPDIPTWAYWLLIPVVILLVVAWRIISSDYRPRYPKQKRKK
jgi:hypothetical protein